MEILTDDKTLGFQQLNEFAANPVLICVGMVSEGWNVGGMEFMCKGNAISCREKEKGYHPFFPKSRYTGPGMSSIYSLKAISLKLW